ncbi:MAG TPA: DUF3352 domain-containing protein [Gaiellaceae bacterium]|jgi:hypothetical protein|nr:DUF3352 domain-containing protein [Gaiellaceae bacterium]
MIRTLRVLPIALLATLAVAVAGCGGGTAQTSSSTESGAKLVRAGALAFVALDSDFGSGQWQQLDDLANKFPGRDKALGRIKQELAKHGVDYEDDIKPALGPEVDFVFANGPGSPGDAVVALTKPDDPAKIKALVAKLKADDPSGEPAVYRALEDGWYALSDKQTTIDRVLAASGGQSLADDSTFKAAFAELPGDALIKAFLDGHELNAAIEQSSERQPSALDASTLGLDKLDYIAASATAEDDGVRIHGASSGAVLGSGDFSSKLLDAVPGDALALLDFRGAGTTDQLEKLEANPSVAQALRQIEAGLGVSYDDILDLLHNEVALYVRPGAGIPEVTLALESKDPTKALSTLDKLAARLAAATGAQLHSGTQGGHDVKTLDLGRFSIHYGNIGDTVVLTSALNGIADYGAPGDHLPDSADFKQAQDAAGMPDSTGGFIYLDLKNSIPLIEGLAGLAGKSPPQEVTENLRPLRSFLAWVEGSGDTRSFDAFLEIK